MKKSLLISFLIWIGAGCGYYFLIHGRFEQPADWICALIGGTAAAMGLGCLRSMFIAFQDKSLIKNSRQARLPNSKKMIAITGRVIALGTPLKTPFSEQDAVLYSYDIFDHHFETVRDADNKTRTESRTSIKLTGHELTPCEIQSNWGNVKLLSYPSLEGFREEYVDQQNTVSKAKEFVARTKFEDMTGVQVMKVVREAKDLYTDSDGTISKHLTLDKNYNLEELRFKEQLVRNGEEVCAVGCYDPQKQGIIPDFTVGGGICRLYRGGQKEAVRKINHRIFGLFFGAIFLLGIVNAVMFFVLKRYDNADTQIVKRTARLVDAITSEESEKIKEISKYSVDVNLVDSAGQSPLMLVRDAETAQILIAKGANLELRDSNGRNALMLAAQYARADVVDELLKAGANPNQKDDYNYTALYLARENNNEEIVNALLKAGAIDDKISEANGTTIGIDSEAVKVCLNYIQAIHKEDRETMKSLCTARPADFFETINFTVWKETRPTNPILIQAFEKDDKANVSINGGPGTLNFEYQLSKVDGSWKIDTEKVKE